MSVPASSVPGDILHLSDWPSYWRNETRFSSDESSTLYAMGHARPRILRYSIEWDTYVAPNRDPAVTHQDSDIYWVCRNSTVDADHTIFLSTKMCPVAAVDWGDIYAGYVSDQRFYLFNNDRGKVYMFSKRLFDHPTGTDEFVEKTYDEFFWNQVATSTSVSSKMPIGK